MSYIYKTILGSKNLEVEYCYSSLDNCIKVVEMSADGKFHRANWMSDGLRNQLMKELKSDYDQVILDKKIDYVSELD